MKSIGEMIRSNGSGTSSIFPEDTLLGSDGLPAINTSWRNKGLPVDSCLNLADFKDLGALSNNAPVP